MSENKENFSGDLESTKAGGLFSGGEFGGDSFHLDTAMNDDFYKELFGETKTENNIEDTMVVKSVKEEKKQEPAAAAVPSASTGSIDPDDFEIDFDFEKEYGESQEEKTAIVKRRKGRKTGCVGGILYFLFIVCVSAILAMLLWTAATDVLALGKEDSDVEVTIPKDYTMEEVGDILYSNNLIKYKSIFKLYSSFSHAEEKIDAGTYLLNTNYDYRALVNGMSKDTGKLIEVEVTIPEGYTLLKTFALLEEQKVCDAESLWDAAANYDFDYDFLSDDTLGNERRLEGYLFPDTYKFYQNDEPEDVIEKMLDNFDYRITDEMYAIAEENGYTMAEVITVASLIEREAGSDEERDLIASVIYNRLESDSFPFLGLDSTIHYAIAGTDQSFSTEIDSPYNSYTNQGLPPTPIANPGMRSIEAALHPEDSSYYFFALSTSGTHEFFTNSDAFYAFLESDEYGG